MTSELERQRHCVKDLLSISSPISSHSLFSTNLPSPLFSFQFRGKDQPYNIEERAPPLSLLQCVQIMSQLANLSLGDALSAVCIQLWTYPRSPSLEEILNAADQYYCQAKMADEVDTWRRSLVPPSPVHDLIHFQLPVRFLYEFVLHPSNAQQSKTWLA